MEDITLGEMTFADGGKGATLTSEYDATGATINADNLKFTEASRSLMTSGSSMTIVDASAAIKNAGGNALPSFAAKNYDSTFTDSVTDQLTLTGTRRDTLTQDAAQTKLTYTVGDRVKHSRFGEGIVEKIEDGARDYEVTVRFDSHGVKKMFAGFAKLQKI